MTELRCSVVVATCNRVFLLNRLLESLRAQDLSPEEFEVVVVDDGSRDGTYLLLQTAKTPFKLKGYTQTNAGPAAARNRGIRNASSELIVTLDDDVVASPGLLRHHIELHASRQRVAGMGIMTLPSDKRLKPWLEWDALTLDKQYQAMTRGVWGPTPRQFYTANASFRKQDAIDAGLFDTNFRRAEDVDLAYRMRDLGVDFVFLPQAVVFHEPNRTYQNWLRIPWLYGHYDVVMWRTKRRDEIVQAVRNEFVCRQPVLQIVAKVVVGRRRMLNGFSSLAATLASLAASARLRRASLAMYSAIFNLQYWQGFCETTGGRAAFWASLEEAAQRYKEALKGQLATSLPDVGADAR